MNAAAIEQRLDRIEQMLSQLTAAFAVSITPSQVLSIGDQALQLARQGKLEESKALLRSYSKNQSRRAANGSKLSMS